MRLVALLKATQPAVLVKKRKKSMQMKKLMIDEIPEHDRRRYGAALLDILNQLRSDPDTLAKIKARAAENAERGIG